MVSSKQRESEDKGLRGRPEDVPPLDQFFRFVRSAYVPVLASLGPSVAFIRSLLRKEGVI